MEIVDTAVLGLILAATTSCVALTGWLSYRSLPNTLRNGQSRLVADVGDIRHDWEVTKLQLTEIVEGLEDVHERLKRSKASNRAVQQRIELAGEGEEGGDKLMQLRKRAGLR